MAFNHNTIDIVAVHDEQMITTSSVVVQDQRDQAFGNVNHNEFPTISQSSERVNHNVTSTNILKNILKVNHTTQALVQNFTTYSNTSTLTTANDVFAIKSWNNVRVALHLSPVVPEYFTYKESIQSTEHTPLSTKRVTTHRKKTRKTTTKKSVTTRSFKSYNQNITSLPTTVYFVDTNTVVLYSRNRPITTRPNVATLVQTQQTEFFPTRQTIDRRKKHKKRVITQSGKGEPNTMTLEELRAELEMWKKKDEELAEKERLLNGKFRERAGSDVSDMSLSSTNTWWMRLYVFAKVWSFLDTMWQYAIYVPVTTWKATSNFVANVREKWELSARYDKLKADLDFWHKRLLNFDISTIEDSSVLLLLEIKSALHSLYHAYHGDFNRSLEWASNFLVSRFRELLKLLSCLNPVGLVDMFKEPKAEIDLEGRKYVMNPDEYEATAEHHDAGGDPSEAKVEGVTTDTGYNDVFTAIVGAVAQTTAGHYTRDDIKSANDQFTFVNHTKRIADDNLRAATTLMSVLSRQLYGVDAMDPKYCSYVSKLHTVIEFAQRENMRSSEMPAHLDRMKSIIRMQSKCHELSLNIRFNSVPKSLQDLYRKHYAILVELAKRANGLLKGAKERDMPSFILFTGQPGVGKSRMYDVIQKAICADQGIEYSKSLVYTKPTGSQYYENYANQMFVERDDLWKGKRDDERTQDSMEIIDNINTVATFLDQAFENKGLVSFDSPWFFGSTNLYDDGIYDSEGNERAHFLGVHQPKAVIRRIMISLHRNDQSKDDVLDNTYEIQLCPYAPHLIGKKVTAMEAAKLIISLRKKMLAKHSSQQHSQEEIARLLNDTPDILLEAGDDEWPDMSPSEIVMKNAEQGLYSWFDSKYYPLYAALAGIVLGAAYAVPLYQFFFPITLESQASSYSSSTERYYRKKYKDRDDYTPGFKRYAQRANTVERDGNMHLQSNEGNYIQSLKTKVSRGLYFIRAEGFLPGSKEPAVKAHVAATHFKDRIIGVSNHFFFAFMRCDRVVFHITYEGKEYTCDAPTVFVSIEETDYMLMRLPNNIPQAVSLLPYVIEPDHLFELTPGMNLALLTMRAVGKPILKHLVRSPYDKEITYSQNGETFIIEEPITYFEPTESGDSGSPIFAEGPQGRPCIVGFHCGYQESFRKKIRFAFPTNSNIINKAIDFVLNADAHEKVSTEADIEEFPHQIKYMVDKSQSHNPPRVSQIKRSRLWGYAHDPTEVPTHLKTFTKNGVLINPMFVAMKKLHQHPTPATDLPESLEAYLWSLYGARGYKILTWDQVINGCPEIGVTSINMGSSPGHPWSLKPGKGKEPYLVRLPDDKFGYSPEFLEHLERKWAGLLRGEQFVVLWADILKDERRPIEKVDMGKSRMFSSCPLDFNCICRRAFAPFCAYVAKRCTTHPISVGLNAHSWEWTQIYNRLSKHKGSVIAGDFSNFDGKLPAFLGSFFVKFVNRWFNDGPEMARLRELLMEHIITAHHIYECNVYTVADGNPSGNPITSIYNSFLNLMMFYTVLTEDFGLTRDEFDLVLYGDDNLTTTAKSGITVNKMAPFFKSRFDMDLTHWSKKEHDAHDTLQTVQFIGRSFKKDGLIIRAPLNVKVIIEALYWRKGAAPQDELLVACIESFLIECTHHGQVVFDSLVADLLCAVENPKYNVTHLLPTVEAMCKDFYFFHNRMYYPKEVKDVIISQSGGVKKYVMQRKQPSFAEVEEHLFGTGFQAEARGESLAHTKHGVQIIRNNVITEAARQREMFIGGETPKQPTVDPFNIPRTRMTNTQILIGAFIGHRELFRPTLNVIRSIAGNWDWEELSIARTRVIIEPDFSTWGPEEYDNWEWEDWWDQLQRERLWATEWTHEHIQVWNVHRENLGLQDYMDTRITDIGTDQDQRDAIVQYWDMVFSEEDPFDNVLQHVGRIRAFMSLRGDPEALRDFCKEENALSVKRANLRLALEPAITQFLAADPTFDVADFMDYFYQISMIADAIVSWCDSWPYGMFSGASFMCPIVLGFWASFFYFFSNYTLKRLKHCENKVVTEALIEWIDENVDLWNPIHVVLVFIVACFVGGRLGLMVHEATYNFPPPQHIVHLESGRGLSAPDQSSSSNTRNEEYTDRATNEVTETQEIQLGAFNDVSEIETTSLGDLMQPVFRPTNMETFDLNGAFNRSYEMATITWDSSQTTNTLLGTYSFPSALFAQQFLAAKLSDFKYFKAAIRMTFRVVTHRQLYGKVMAYFEPWLSLTSFAALTTAQASGNPHRLLSAAPSSVIVWDLPFIENKRALAINNFDPIELGTVKIRVLNQIRNVDGSPVQAQIYVTAQFLEAKTFMPHGTIDLMTGVHRRGKPTKEDPEKEEDYDFDTVVTESGREAVAKSRSGIISSILESTSALASRVAAIPFSSYASSIATVTKSGAVVARMAGLDMPATLASTDVNKIDPHVGMMNGKGVSKAQAMAMDPENAISTVPNVGGVSKDEMMLSYVLETPHLCSISDWLLGSSPAMIMSAGPFDPILGFCSFVQQNFMWWSGAYRVMIDITASQFHTVRGVFWWTETGDTEYQNCYHQIVEFTGDCVYKWTMPYSEQSFAHASNAGSNYGLFFKILAFSVSDPSISLPISLNVYKAAAPGFKVSGHRERRYTVTQCDPRWEFANTEFPPFHSSMTALEANGLMFGEEHTTIRDLLHRYQPMRAVVSPLSTYTPSVPGFAGYQRMGISLWANLFRFWRGSIRIKMIWARADTYESIYLTTPIGTLAGMHVSHPTNTTLEVAAPYYYNTLWQSTDANAVNTWFFSDNQSKFMCESIGDDFSFHWLRSIPQGTFSNIIAPYGNAGLSSFITNANQVPTLTITTTPAGVSSLVTTAT